MASISVTRKSLSSGWRYIERLRNSGEFENAEMKNKLASVLGFFSASALFTATVDRRKSTSQECGAWLLPTTTWRFLLPGLG